MRSERSFLPVLLGLVLLGCVRSYQVVQVPQYEADLYPLAQTKAGITIAIDEIKRPERAQRYFGADLIKAGILPVHIVISNHGKHRVAVKPSDIILHRGKEVLDPLPLELVAARAKRQQRFLSADTEEEISKFFDDAIFKERVVAPNDTHRGVIFFAVPPPKKATDRFFTSLSVFREGGPRIRVGVTNLDTSERLLFGPFSLALPEGAGPY